MLTLQLTAFLFTYWVASDVLSLLAFRFARPANDDSRLGLYLLTRGLGPMAIAWLLFRLIQAFPHRPHFFYIAIVLAAFAAGSWVGRSQLAQLVQTYRRLWTILASCWPHTLSGKLLLMLASGLVAFVFVIGVGFPIVEGDALGFAVEARLIHRDLGFDHYPTFAADPQTGYYYQTFQVPCLQSLYVWFLLLTGTVHGDVLLRTVAPMYAFYCTLILAWVLLRKTQCIETALWGIVALLSIPVFVVHSWMNTQDPHRIYLSFCALLCLATLLESSTKRNAAVLGVFLGFGMYAHFFGVVTATLVFALYVLLSHAPLHTRLAQLLIVGLVALPLSGMDYYAAGGPGQTPGTRVLHQFEFESARDTTQLATQDLGSDWLLGRRGQAGGINRFVFGILLPFTGIEWFGFSFWFCVAALIYWMRQSQKTTLETIMAWTVVVYLAVVLSGVRTLSWSNPRYTGTLAPVLAYFAGTFAAALHHRRRQKDVAGSRLVATGLVIALVFPLGLTTFVRGAKVGITNPGDFYEKLHSTVWIHEAVRDPIGGLHSLWTRYSGGLQTLRYAWASDHEKLLHSHDYFRAVDYMSCCTPKDATGLVIGRETYYFYYARRRGASYADPRLRGLYAGSDPVGTCTALIDRGVQYVLIDSYYVNHPAYVAMKLPAVLNDPALATPVFEAGSARVYRLLCGTTPWPERSMDN